MTEAPPNKRWRETTISEIADVYGGGTPSTVTIAKFSEYVGALYDLADEFTLQCHSLSEAQDLLLPRLISGNLELPQLDIEGSALK